MSEVTYKVHEAGGISAALSWVFDMLTKGLKGGPVVITLGREKRSSDQNRKLWPMLTDISQQVVWHGEKYSKEAWKDIISAGWFKQTLVPGIDGGFVALGVRTSELTKEQFSGLIECIYAFGAQHDVQWSEPALRTYEEYRETKQEQAA